MFRIQRIAAAAIVAAALASPAIAQQNSSQVTQADIQRLQDSVFQAGSDVQQLKGRDSSRASQLQTQLDDLRDEVIYFKVKLRKEGSLQRNEYANVRDRLDDLRSQATKYTTNYTPSTGGNASAATGTTGNTTYRPSTGSAATGSQSSSTTRNTAPSQSAAAGREVEVPSGTEMDVRLTNTLNSGIAQVEDRFEGTTLVDLNINGRTVIPAGSVMRGVVTSVDPATRTNLTAKMTVSFDHVTVNGRNYPIPGTVTQAIQGEGIKGETGRIATGAGGGAFLGGILGGFKGSLAAILIGAAGTIAPTT